MNGTKHTAIALANSGVDKTTPLSARTTPVQEILTEFFRDLQHIKPWSKVAEILGLSNDTAKNRIKGSREFTADELAALIRSEHGFEILSAVMAGSRAKWWKLCVPLMECAEAQRLQAVAKRKIRKAVEGALDADRDLTAAIARADALLVHDEDFHGVHRDALRSVARVSAGAVAQGTKGRRG